MALLESLPPPRRATAKPTSCGIAPVTGKSFFITATYDLQVTGNLEKALLTCELWVHTYPREIHPYPLLGAFLYPTFGKYEKGVEAAKQAIELDPDFPIGYLQLGFNSQFLGRVGEAEKALQRASDRKLDTPDFLPQRYDIAFLNGDKAGMDREVTLAQGRPGAEDAVSLREGFVLAYSGHLQQARRRSRHAVDLAQQANQRGRAALFETAAAVWEAFFWECDCGQTGRRGGTGTFKGSGRGVWRCLCAGPLGGFFPVSNARE